ncbi:RadC family protein [Stutzerimonas stutzeri]|uniref:RadC family protein n=1 Tax=Stutzerimonas stutzeri TaxID=316 RepID=UPI000F7A90A4|nr:DNA repair protein RadC [Stutzerimonas stutzeri]RSH69203.1 DNA repair protein RadC [Stutzerimonas stutzeri]
MPRSLTVIDAHSRLASSDEHENRIIQQAIALLEHRLFAQGPLLQSPQDAQDYLRLTLMPEPNEVFVACFLSSRHQVIACETLFRGTIDSATIHPRVVIQRGLERNCSALIIAHNHPSGDTEPSSADKVLTQRLKLALEYVNIRLLDHFIIGRGKPFSFAEAGLL